MTATCNPLLSEPVWDLAVIQGRSPDKPGGPLQKTIPKKYNISVNHLHHIPSLVLSYLPFTPAHNYAHSVFCNHP